MDENESSIVEILSKNSGMQLEEWITMIKILDLDSRDKIVKFLMEYEGLTYRTARFIAYKAITKLKH
ncbi:MAG: hypothetical protein ACXIUQ_01600 [Cecembia sp.]